jgi:hypothetical protein
MAFIFCSPLVENKKGHLLDDLSILCSLGFELYIFKQHRCVTHLYFGIFIRLYPYFLNSFLYNNFILQSIFLTAAT